MLLNFLCSHVSARFNKNKLVFEIFILFLALLTACIVECKGVTENTSTNVFFFPSSFHHYLQVMHIYTVIAKNLPLSCKFKNEKNVHGCFRYALKRTNICDNFDTRIFAKVHIHIYVHRCNLIGVK